MILGTYHEEYGELREDEWLLKIRETPSKKIWQDGRWVETKPHKTGFLSKLTKKGELPKPFVNWGGIHYGESGRDLPIYVFKEDYRTGWELLSWRFGKSQNWATVMHPEGFTLEIYLDNFLEVIKNDTLDHGTILGEYKWIDNKLIKKSE